MIDKRYVLSIVHWHKINNEILQSINTYKENSAVDSFIVRTCKSSTASRWKNINFKIKLWHLSNFQYFSVILS